MTELRRVSCRTLIASALSLLTIIGCQTTGGQDSIGKKETSSGAQAIESVLNNYKWKKWKFDQIAEYLLQKDFQVVPIDTVLAAVPSLRLGGTEIEFDAVERSYKAVSRAGILFIKVLGEQGGGIVPRANGFCGEKEWTKGVGHKWNTPCLEVWSDSKGSTLCLLTWKESGLMVPHDCSDKIHWK